MALTPTTKLEAVNSMLAAIGEHPISDINSPTPDAAKAISILDEVCRDVQQEGWSWNTDLQVTLSPDGSSNIVVPTDALRVKIDPNRYSLSKPVVRAGKLYNRVDQTFVFSDAVVADEIVRALNYEDMPEGARKYIKIKAAREFISRTLPEQIVLGYTDRDEIIALTDLRNEEHEANDAGMRTSPGIIDILGR